MKKNKLIIVLIALIGFTGCNESFLDKPDLDSISSDSFWQSPRDLDLYITNFYTSLPGWSPGAWNGGIYWWDTNTDNMIYFNVGTRLQGNNLVTTSNNTWDYENIREVNVFLENYTKVEASPKDIAQSVGEAYFFRAWYYFILLQNYGDVPWVDKPLLPDSEELFAERTPRNVVVDNILADLDKAIGNLPSGRQSGGQRLCMEVAKLFKSRVALYEGTWEKYHAGTPFAPSTSDPNKYLQIAADVAGNLIDKPGGFSIYNTGKVNEDYRMLFNQDDYSFNDEVMMWRAFDRAQGIAHNGQRYLPRIGGGRGFTKSLVEDYLCTDGKPISSSPLYQGDRGLTDFAENRDPRLSQTIWLPGQEKEIGGEEIKYFKKPPLTEGGSEGCATGYMIRKGANINIEQFNAGGVGQTSSPTFRFAEVLLIFAEAKAELGTITQDDINKSINVLKKRVGLPDLKMANIENDPKWIFPALSPLINEIRRERRVELAAEGYRFGDLMRWAAADEVIVGKRYKGIFFQQSDFPDAVIGTDVLLDSDGYVDKHQTQVPNGYGFKVERDYLLAVPLQQITLNPALTQNPGWSGSNN